MPRLSSNDYIQIHYRLRHIWLNDKTLFTELSPNDQWHLHDFFVPAKDLTNADLLLHRTIITQQHPSLPHQAGRALNRFWGTTARVGLRRVAQAKAPATHKRIRPQDRRLIIKPLVRPEIDAHKLARAIINLAYDRARHAGEDNHNRSRP